MDIPELLAPAGSPESLNAAINEGADAVYLGLKDFNARLRSSNFSYAQFEALVRVLHKKKRKVYVTVNTVFEQREDSRIYQLLKYLEGVGPDALIVQDLGVAYLVQSCGLRLTLHASTQMNVASAHGANALSKYGFSRVILSRELTRTELESLRSGTNVELELFVHGALCISCSGLCLFSSFLGGKSANRGICTQACRRLYHQNEESGYYFSPHDLQLIEKIPALSACGIRSFKIEGRMKSAEYVATVVAAYRNVLDSLGSSDDLLNKAIYDSKAMLDYDFARSKTSFYLDSPTVTWLDPAQNGSTGIYIGTIRAVKRKGTEKFACIDGSRIQAGDSIRLHKHDDTKRHTYKVHTINTMDGSTQWINISDDFDKGDSVYLIQIKAHTKHYAPIIPDSLSGFKRRPGFEKAPVQPIKTIKRHLLAEGLYVAVNGIEDLYIVQSVRPAKVIVPLNQQTLPALLNTVPFRPADIIITLNPFFPQELEQFLGHAIQKLINHGYRYFIANNVGHYSYLRGTDTVCINGPYLYTFNRFALLFTEQLGAQYWISPLENNRQNIERTVDYPQRSFVCITVFSYPALFRIRATLPYSFTDFSDNTGEHFQYFKTAEGSLVRSKQPFSLIDKIPFLKEAGFRRFIIDCSGQKLKKSFYKDLLHAVQYNRPIPQSSRFNWKNGFYSEPPSAS
ncbi:putative U32 family peptidase [Pillotina sp. SPG140]|jgi:putative protease